MRGRRTVAFLALVALPMTACDGGGSTDDGPPGASDAPAARNPAEFVQGEPYLPAIDPADFVAEVDNPYFPLEPGTVRIYEGTSDGETERVEVTVTREQKEVLGIAVTVVHDQVFVDDELVEDTFDWFAQDRWGNVWYLGEDTSEIENGEVVNHAGAWGAGVDGAQPGIVMLAEPRVGDVYRQEFFAGEAEDMAEVAALDGSVEVPTGAYDAVLVTHDTTPLEPGIVEEKSYARGIGVVFEEKIAGGDGVLELVEIRTL